MANRETYPASQSPLQGDIDGPAGATQVRVTGIQSVPVVSTPPADKNILVFFDALGKWVPSDASAANRSIQVNDVTVSDDYDIAFNLPLSTTNSPVFVNGV